MKPTRLISGRTISSALAEPVVERMMLFITERFLRRSVAAGLRHRVEDTLGIGCRVDGGHGSGQDEGGFFFFQQRLDHVRQPGGGAGGGGNDMVPGGVEVGVVDPLHQQNAVIGQRFGFVLDLEGSRCQNLFRSRFQVAAEAPVLWSAGRVGSRNWPVVSTTSRTPSFLQAMSFGFLASRRIFTVIPSISRIAWSASTILISHLRE